MNFLKIVLVLSLLSFVRLAHADSNVDYEQNYLGHSAALAVTGSVPSQQYETQRNFNLPDFRIDRQPQLPDLGPAHFAANDSVNMVTGQVKKGARRPVFHPTGRSWNSYFEQMMSLERHIGADTRYFYKDRDSSQDEYLFELLDDEPLPSEVINL